MALKTKNDDNDEDTKLKSYITRQFKKFIKNANVNADDKDRKQIAFSQYKSQDKGKRESKDVGQSNTSKFNSKFFNLYIYIYINRLENFVYIVTKITEIYKNC